MLFRNANPGEIDALLAQMRHLYEHDGAPFDALTSRRAALQLMRDPQAGTIQIMEAEDGTIAGYFVLTFGYSLEYGGRYGLLDEIYVDARHRGKGYGTAAVEHVRQMCVERQAASLLLEVDDANERAADLYRRLGFRENSRMLMRLKVQNT